MIGFVVFGGGGHIGFGQRPFGSHPIRLQTSSAGMASTFPITTELACRERARTPNIQYPAGEETVTTGARLIALACCLVAFPAAAQNAPKQGDWSFMNYSWGSRSCGTWLEARANRNIRGLDVNFYGASNWIDGFLTAYNIFFDPMET
jgi:hypothetical protein